MIKGPLVSSRSPASAARPSQGWPTRRRGSPGAGAGSPGRRPSPRPAEAAAAAAASPGAAARRRGWAGRTRRWPPPPWPAAGVTGARRSPRWTRCGPSPRPAPAARAPCASRRSAAAWPPRWLPGASGARHPRARRCGTPRRALAALRRAPRAARGSRPGGAPFHAAGRAGPWGATLYYIAL